MVCECDLVFRVVAKQLAEGVVSGLRSGDDEVGKGGMGRTGGCTSLSGDSSPRNREGVPKSSTYVSRALMY